MKIILPLGILLIVALHIPARGEESYPILYRGEVTESGPRLLAHFENSFLRLAPTEQMTHLRKIEKELKKPRLEPEIYPGLEEKERFKNLYSIITDRLDQIYYVVSGFKFYPIRAKGFHLIQDAADCRRILSVAIETEWVTFDSPEKTEAPPLLNLNRDPDGALIFSGRPFTPIDEFQQIKFQPIQYPKDLPEVLKELFKEETDFSDKRSRPALFFSAPRTGFLPLEVTLWSNLLPSDTALTFFYERNGFWNKIHLPFERQENGRYFIRPISRFDLNRNGRMEYLVEVEEDYPISRFFNKPEKVSRLIYEVDEDSAESLLMTATLDHVFIQGTRGSKRGSCRE